MTADLCVASWDAGVAAPDRVPVVISVCFVVAVAGILAAGLACASERTLMGAGENQSSIAVRDGL